jgi:multidrug efflux system outer membrane protein
MNRKDRLLWAPAAVLAGACLSSCAVGPNFSTPQVDTPATYKSATQPSSQPASRPASQPRLGRNWWRLFGDPKLNELAEASLQANQDIQAAMARLAQARAGSDVVRSQFFPSINFNPSVIRSRPPAGNARAPLPLNTNYLLPFDLSYEIDIWGRVRRSYEAAQAQVQASADDLAVIQQTVLADVAVNYFSLRSLDAQAKILADNVVLYRKQVSLTQAQLKAGMVGQVDVAQALTLLDSTITLEIEVRRQRADVEHALAVLVGRTPAELSLPNKPMDLEPPVIPPGLPSDLLRRRPDVAEAEQGLAAASAQIGVATANFFPVVTLTGLAGFESMDVEHMFDWQRRIWSVGPTVSAPIFEGGRLTASLRQAKARYEELLAIYRTTVLTAFREVEDSLTDIHFHANGGESQARAVASAREAVRLSLIQYHKGLTNYLLVVDTERTLLTNELSAVQILNQRLAATVLLIKALGGGWDPKAPTTQPTTQPTP